MIETAKPEPDFEKLRARAAIGAGEFINEVEFGARVHDRKLTPDEIAALVDGLKSRGLWEPRV